MGNDSASPLVIPKQDESERQEALQSKVDGPSLGQGLDRLESKGFKCCKMDWREFIKEVWTEDRSKVDSIISESSFAPSISSFVSVRTTSVGAETLQKKTLSEYPE